MIIEKNSSASRISLLDAIEKGRAMAKDIDHGDSRSRRRLYEVLARAYAVLEESERSPDTYNLILSAAGLRVQARAPFTPVLKLIFGRDYDKTRLTEYAAALRLAMKMELAPSVVADFIENQPGGIKGCVRRVRIESKRFAKPIDTSKLFEDLPALGSISWFASAPVTGKLVVLVARQTGDNRKPEIIAGMDQNSEGFADLIQQLRSKLK